MYWIQSILTDRSEKGLVVTLYAVVRTNPDKFFMFARMSISYFDELTPNSIYSKLMPICQIPNFWFNLNLVNKSFIINFYVISIHDYKGRNTATKKKNFWVAKSLYDKVALLVIIISIRWWRSGWNSTGTVHLLDKYNWFLVWLDQ